MEEKGANENLKTPCIYNNLLKEYGPDYEGIKRKLGFVREFDDL